MKNELSLSIQKEIKEKINTIPDYPKKGIMFRDITSLIGDAQGLQNTIQAFINFCDSISFDAIAGIEARGFIFAPILAYHYNLPFIPIRKKGKLPGKTYSQDYKLEYGEDSLEIHQDSIQAGQKILLIDDLLATGGTALAATKLIKQAGGIVKHSAFVVDLPDLLGKKLLHDHDILVHCLVSFEGE